jgi:hypothetical protein
MSAPPSIPRLPRALPVAALWPEPRTPAELRACGALYRAGIQDAGSLTRCTAGGLLKVDGFGVWALEQVRQRLGRLGLSLLGEQVQSASACEQAVSAMQDHKRSGGKNGPRRAA